MGTYRGIALLDASRPRRVEGRRSFIMQTHDRGEAFEISAARAPRLELAVVVVAGRECLGLGSRTESAVENDALFRK